jgi:hypothetical protein
MRFAHFAAFGCCAFCSLAAAAGCSDTTPAPAEGGFSVEFTSGTSGTCDNMMAFNGDVGTVSQTSPKGVVADGSKLSGGGTASIDCVVSGTKTFHVEATLTGNSNSLHVDVGSITMKATEASPAHGTVSFASPNTGGAAYASDPNGCDFWFTGGQEVVGGATGKIWVSFACDKVKDSRGACGLDQGALVLENCTSTEASTEE